MVYKISDKQKELFADLSGVVYDESKIKRLDTYDFDEETDQHGFRADYPFGRDKNDEAYPWWFSYVFNESDGTLICELSHRFTNNRVYGWYQNGTKIPYKICDKIYPSDI